MKAMNRVRESEGKDVEALEEAQRLVAAREAFFEAENAYAKKTGGIPPISSHRFKITEFGDAHHQCTKYKWRDDHLYKAKKDRCEKFYVIGKLFYEIRRTVLMNDISNSHSQDHCNNNKDS
jgi:hypothetical protein